MYFEIAAFVEMKIMNRSNAFIRSTAAIERSVDSIQFIIYKYSEETAVETKEELSRYAA